MRVLITGGAGFIGSHLTQYFVQQGHTVCVADRFTYAGKGRNLSPVLAQITLLIGDLATGELAARCAAWQPEWVVHLAAETHVDRAIEAPEIFVTSNALGTTRFLQALWTNPQARASVQKAVVYSTDEVFGSTPPGVAYDEQTPFRPSNAYAASKMAVEGMVQAFWTTHQLPLVIVRPCNTYGPGQHPEKVIPKFIGQFLRGEAVTVYNTGSGARDWLHVHDHARAIATLLQRGCPGAAYNLGAGDEHSDLEIARAIFAALVDLGALPPGEISSYLTFTPGRPGHDARYFMDARKLRALGWQPRVPFSQGFHETAAWTVAHLDWWDTDNIHELLATLGAR